MSLSVANAALPVVGWDGAQFIAGTGGDGLTWPLVAPNGARVVPLGTDSSVIIESATATAYASGATSAMLTANLYMDGAGWQRFNTANPGCFLSVGSGTNALAIWATEAGANPVSAWTNGAAILTVDPVGNLTTAGNVSAQVVLPRNNIRWDLPSGAATIMGADYGAPYVQISQLSVTPGTTALAGLGVNGNVTVSGDATFSSSVFIGGAAGGSLFWSGSWLWAQPNLFTAGDVQTGANVQVNGGAVFLNAARTASVSFNASSQLVLNGGLVITSSDLWISGSNVYMANNAGYMYRLWADRHNFVGGAGILSEAAVYARGRLVTNNWDGGWDNNLGGNLIISGLHIRIGGNGGIGLDWGVGGRPHISSTHAFEAGAFWIAGGGAVWFNSGTITWGPAAGWFGEVLRANRAIAGSGWQVFQTGTENRTAHCDENGNLTANNVSWSERKAKFDIGTFKGGWALERVRDTRVQPSTFQWRHNPGTTHLGLIADEVAKVVPELGYHDERGELMGYESAGVVALLWAALRESVDQQDALTARLETLMARVTELEGAHG
jgi:hypothetical protein